MAIDDLVGDLFGDAVDAVTRRKWEGWVAMKTLLVEWLRDVAQPPAGVELKTDDGSSYSGVVLIERNELRLMIAVRHPPGPVSHAGRSHSQVSAPAPPRDLSPLTGYPDPDDPIWDRDGDPFRR